ncbi:MAG: hypothetical protein H6597_05450 [Flavobacteriales bacterium]|nr:hypothetical protein [Flavobacteriales bacterium]MCB9193961.1 hypothetical protein [Flavobacteriales bacterium]
MKTRPALAILLLSFALLTLGGLFKLLRWPGANIQLLVGTFMQVCALVALAINVLRGQALKVWLES